MTENARRRTRRAPAQDEAVSSLNREHKRIMTWLSKVRFKRKLFGGVNERDVWKKIEELNSMYNLALIAERARYDALLQARRSGAEAGIDTTSEGKEGGEP